MKKNINKYKSFLIYSFAFFIVIAFLCLIFKINDKNFIWESDGFQQHILTLYNYRDVVINFLKTGTYSTFNWHVGLGLDLFSNYAYYIIGDVFSYIVIFFSKSSVFHTYNLLVIIRWFFVGISFLCFCKYRKFKNFSSVIGALMYTFSAYAFYAFVRHPFFINSVILFPLLMIGIEKIILEDKCVYYTLIIGIMYIVSFYFAYMMSLIIAIYGIILIINNYKKEGIKNILKRIFKVLLYSILGILLSSVVLLPTAYAFFNSERSTSAGIYPYRFYYYQKFLNNIIGYTPKNSYWVFIGVQSIILLALPNFIKDRKKEKPMFLLLLLLMIPLLFSQVGSIFAGFNYSNNRWSFVITFIFAYITVLFLNSSKKINYKYLITVLFIISIIFISNYIFDIDFNDLIIAQLFILFLMIIVYLYQDKLKDSIKIKKYSIFILFIIGLILNINYIYNVNNIYNINNDDYISDFMDSKSFQENFANSNGDIKGFQKAIKYLNNNDKTLYKVGKYPNSYDNISTYYNFNSMSSYYSITPSYIQEINEDLLNSQYAMNHGLNELDYRTKITSLLGNKYIITRKQKIIPYGYKELTNYNGSAKIYVNENYANFATLYTNYITEEEYNKMSPLEKEDSLLKNVVLEKNNNKLSHINNKTESIKEIKYELFDNNNITDSNKIKIMNNTKNYIEIKTEDIQNSEVYIYFENLEFHPFTKEEYIKNYLENNFKTPYTKYQINLAKNYNKWYQEHYKYKMGINGNNGYKSKTIEDCATNAYCLNEKNMLFNLGYHKDGKEKIKISLSTLGYYTYDNIKIYAVSFDKYEEDIKKLNESNFELINYDNNIMNAKVNPIKDGVLQFSTFYNKGWNVYVDGKKVETFKANKYFLGINIDKGNHTIELRYKTPYLKEGLIITIISSIALISISLINKRKKLKNNFRSNI